MVKLNVRKMCLTLGLLGALAALADNGASSVDTYDWRSAESRMNGDLCDTQDKDFDGFRYKESIPHCRRNVSLELKRFIANGFGIYDNYQGYEIDHYIPLSIGGSNEPENLWPLPVPVARAKCSLEGKVHEEVKEGKLTQEQAIERIRNWKSFINLK